MTCGSVSRVRKHAGSLLNFLFPASLDFLLKPTNLALLSVEMFERREIKYVVKCTWQVIMSLRLTCGSVANVPVLL